MRVKDIRGRNRERERKNESIDKKRKTLIVVKRCQIGLLRAIIR